MTAKAPTLALLLAASLPIPVMAQPATPPAPSYLTTHNYPTRPNPTDDGVLPAGGVRFSGPAVNLANFVFGSRSKGATVRNRDDLDALFDYNMANGNQLNTIGEDGLDGNYGNYRARFRHYPEGDPEDVHVVGTDALYLKAHCQGAGRSDCGDGHIFAGMIRPYLEILPGSYTEACYQADKGPYSWPAIWMFIGSETAPKPGGGDVYSQKRLHYSNIYHEIDLNDGFEFKGIPLGHTLQSGEPWMNTSYQTTKPQIYQAAPHTVYLADGGGFHWDGQHGTMRIDTDLTQAVHCIALDWKGDGSHLLNFLFDGKVFRTDYFEYHPDTYTDASGRTVPVPMHIMISNQIGAKFNDLSGITDQGGVKDGWTMKVVSLRVWRNNATAAATLPNARF